MENFTIVGFLWLHKK